MRGDLLLLPVTAAQQSVHLSGFYANLKQYSKRRYRSLARHSRFLAAPVTALPVRSHSPFAQLPAPADQNLRAGCAGWYLLPGWHSSLSALCRKALRSLLRASRNNISSLTRSAPHCPEHPCSTASRRYSMALGRAARGTGGFPPDWLNIGPARRSAGSSAHIFRCRAPGSISRLSANENRAKAGCRNR
jgi:hypothetical protein